MMVFNDRKDLNRFDRWAVRVSDLMTRDPFSVRAKATVREAISVLSAKGNHAAPIINEAGRPIGVLSLTDLVGGMRGLQHGDGAFFDMQVSELMTPAVFYVDLETPVYAAVGELLDRKIHQMYVADKDGTLIGVLSTHELLEYLHLHSEESCNDECTTTT